MIRIIDGKRYNTETAEKLCDISRRGFYRNDFHYDDTYLYRTSAGAFFISGEGGALSRWSRPIGQNGSGGGDGLRPIDADEARELLEQYGAPEQVEEYFSVVDA
jgi:hypothetical protein